MQLVDSPTDTRAVPVLVPVVDLAGLGVDIATDGFAPHESVVASLVAAARATGVRTGACDALADPTAPRAVRERAYGLVSVALARSLSPAA